MRQNKKVLSFRTPTENQKKLLVTAMLSCAIRHAEFLRATWLLNRRDFLCLT